MPYDTQEERNDPPTPPIELAEELPYLPDNEVPTCFVFLRFLYDYINNPDIRLILFAK